MWNLRIFPLRFLLTGVLLIVDNGAWGRQMEKSQPTLDLTDYIDSAPGRGGKKGDLGAAGASYYNPLLFHGHSHYPVFHHHQGYPHQPRHSYQHQLVHPTHHSYAPPPATRKPPVHIHTPQYNYGPVPVPMPFPHTPHAHHSFGPTQIVQIPQPLAHHHHHDYLPAQITQLPLPHHPHLRHHDFGHAHIAPAPLAVAGPAPEPILDYGHAHSYFTGVHGGFGHLGGAHVSFGTDIHHETPSSYVHHHVG